jgi:FixJ family two-component response regulator
MSVRAMRAGAVNFLTKPVATDELLATVRLALEKDFMIRRDRAEVDSIMRRVETLTPRETEVLRHVISGRLNKQIAADLGTVEKTIKVHRARVMQKLAVRSLAELVRLAERVKIGPRSAPARHS